jgi:hypothetical protein
MGMTLAGAKPKLQLDLYKAFYDAYMTQCGSDPEAGKYNSETNNAMMQAADKFANSLSADMAEAIYNFVKEIGIQATVTGTVIAPSGPCTGSLPPTSFTVI